MVITLLVCGVACTLGWMVGMFAGDVLDDCTRDTRADLFGAGPDGYLD
jgi:hypothetical protein